MLTMLIVILLHHSGCDCAMSTYDSMSIAGAKGESMVWGLGRVTVAWIGLPQKVGEFALP